MPWTDQAGVSPAESGAPIYRDLPDETPLAVFGDLASALAAAKRDAFTYDEGLSGLAQAVSPNARNPLATARVRAFLGSLGDQQILQNPEHAAPGADPHIVRAHAAGWETSKLLKAYRAGQLAGPLADMARRLFDSPDELDEETLNNALIAANQFQAHTSGLDPDLRLPRGMRFVRFDGGPDGVRPFIELDDQEFFDREEFAPVERPTGWFTPKMAWVSDGNKPTLAKMLSGAHEGEKLAVVKDVPESDGLIASPNPDGTLALFSKLDKVPRTFYPAKDMQHGQMYRLVSSVPQIVRNVDEFLDRINQPDAVIQMHSAPSLLPALQEGNHILIEGDPQHMREVKAMLRSARLHVEDLQGFRAQVPGEEGPESRKLAGVLVRLGNSPASWEIQRVWDMVEDFKDDFYDVEPVAYLHGPGPSGSFPAFEHFYVDPAGRQVVHRARSADPFAGHTATAYVPESVHSRLGDPLTEHKVEDVKVAGNTVIVNDRLQIVVQHGQVGQADDFIHGDPSNFTLYIPEHPHRQPGVPPSLPVLTFDHPENPGPRTVLGHVRDGRVELEDVADPEDVGQMVKHQARLLLGAVGIDAR